MQPSQTPLRPAENAGAAAAKAEHSKMSKYKELAKRNIFIPVALETMGVYGHYAWQFIQELGARIRTTTNDTAAGAHLRQRISVAVQRGNAVSVRGTLEKANFVNSVLFM